AEGEKDVDNLRAIGLTATCNPGGAGKWRQEYADCLKSHQCVVILPDNDEAGCGHAKQVAESLTGKVASVKVLELPSLPAKGDVSDWLAAGGTREQLETLADAALEFGLEEGPHPVIVRLCDVQPEQITWLWPHRIAAGKLSLFIGDPGAGKSSASID